MPAKLFSSKITVNFLFFLSPFYLFNSDHGNDFASLVMYLAFISTIIIILQRNHKTTYLDSFIHVALISGLIRTLAQT